MGGGGRGGEGGNGRRKGKGGLGRRERGNETGGERKAASGPKSV